MKVAIIGGSLSGCMAAILVGRAGHHVTVYERSKSGLVGRGGGLTTSRKVLEEMKSLDLLDANFPASAFRELKLMKRTASAPYLGINPLSKAIDMHCVHWGGLWSNLVKRVPSTDYQRGRILTHARKSGTKVRLDFADGLTDVADLVLFCDGYNSLGRRLLFPDCAPAYRGYIVWRGVLSDDQVSDHRPLLDHPRYSFASMKGSFVSFVVPSDSGSTTPGERTINWAAYLPVPEDQLDHYLRDAKGDRRDGTVPAGAVRKELDRQLKDLMAQQLPAYYADILAKSSDTQLQQIYTATLPAYGKDRMALIGDAGMVVQPMTGSGLFKGFSNARDLAEALAETSDVDTALAKWSERQTRVAHQMRDLGNQMEEAFIWNTIDLETESASSCAVWWDRSITVPDSFSYFATAS